MGFDPVSAVGDAIGGVLDGAGKIIDRFVPNASDAAKAKEELESLKQSDATKLALAQIQVNALDAQAPRWFQADWRPFIGWSCGAALTYNYLLRPLLVGFVGEWQGHVFPTLDMSTMMPVLLGLLGLGAMRTVEKLQDKD